MQEFRSEGEDGDRGLYSLFFTPFKALHYTLIRYGICRIFLR
jgi:hypothetical protein